MFTSQKSAALIIASVLFSSVEMLATQQPSNALGDIQVTTQCTAPFIVIGGSYEQNCKQITYETNGGNGNGNNVNIDAANNVGKGPATIRTGGSGGYRIINVRYFRRRVR
jgi:hypothetical protein